VVSSTPRPHFTPGKDSVPILQETGWAPGPVWTGGTSLPRRDSIPGRPARSSVAIPTEPPGPWNKIKPEDIYQHVSNCRAADCLFSLFTYFSVHINTHTKQHCVNNESTRPCPLQSRRDRYCRPALVFKYTLRGRVSGPELPGRGQESWWLSPEPQSAHYYSCITYIRH